MAKSNDWYKSLTKQGNKLISPFNCGICGLPVEQCKCQWGNISKAAVISKKDEPPIIDCTACRTKLKEELCKDCAIHKTVEGLREKIAQEIRSIVDEYLNVHYTPANEITSADSWHELWYNIEKQQKYLGGK